MDNQQITRHPKSLLTGNFTLDFNSNPCPWFRSGLTLGTCSPFPGHISLWWLLMNWLQPQSTSRSSTPSFWITFVRQSSQGCRHHSHCSFFYHTLFQSPFHEYVWIQYSAIRQPFQQWPSVAYPAYGGCQWVSFGQLSSQQSFLMIVNRALLRAVWIKYLEISFSDKKYWTSPLFQFWETEFLIFKSCNHKDQNKKSVCECNILHCVQWIETRCKFYFLHWIMEEKKHFSRLSNFFGMHLYI